MNDLSLYKNKEWLNDIYNEKLVDTKEIAKLCNVSESEIRRKLNDYKISLMYVELELHSRKLYKIKKNNSIYSMKEYLYKQYIVLTKSSSEIGKLLNIDRRAIIQWLKSFEIPRRGNFEKAQQTNSQNSNPNLEQWQIILGSWLGDGNFRTEGVNTQIRITHCEKQYEYLQFKKNVLEKDNFLWFSEYIRNRNPTNAYNIDSQKHKSLNIISEKGYINGSARINKDLLYQVSDLGLYIWYLDDGSLHNKKSIIFCTDAFNISEVKLIQEFLQIKYNINSVIQKIINDSGNIHYRMRLNNLNSNYFFAIISKYYHCAPCMQYKFKEGYKC